MICIVSGKNCDVVSEKSELDPCLMEDMDNAIAAAFLTGTEESMTNLLHLIISENASVDYQVLKIF